MENKYFEVKNEVHDFIIKIESDTKLSHIIKRHYKGTQILLSKLTFRPKLMLIGINPGGGYFNQNKKNIPHFTGLRIQDKHEYSVHDYSLAKNTKKLLRLAGASHLLEDSVKTNCFFFGTKNENELYKFLSHYKEEKIYNKSADWLDRLVIMVEPEIIICEGKSAFDRYIKNKKCDVKIFNGVYHTKYNNIHIIGYKRLFSEILNIDNVAKVLKDKLTETEQK